MTGPTAYGYVTSKVGKEGQLHVFLKTNRNDPSIAVLVLNLSLSISTYCRSS